MRQLNITPSEKHAVVLHPNLFDEVTGSSEKLLRNIAQILADSGQFVVWCVYGDKNHVVIPAQLQGHTNIRLLPFTYEELASKPPWKPVGMTQTLRDIINRIEPTIFVCMVSSGDQWPTTSLPSRVPMLLISPFGDFCSNGNVRRLYVSGAGNVDKLRKKGISFAEIFFNPVEVPPKRQHRSSAHGGPVLFGRIGRSDSVIFDPISILAFAKLEAEFGDEVSYVYVNPALEARELVAKLKLERVFFRNWLSADELNKFYDQIDVLAHARRDGETLGVAIAEAMLHECVIASHKSAFFNEHLFLLREPFGLVAELNDVDQYYENLRSFVRNRAQLGEYGEQARAFASRYFDQKIVGKKIVADCTDMWNYVGKPHPVMVRIKHEYLRFSFWREILIRKLTKAVGASLRF